MHELSVCLALMSQVERVATEHQARRVEKIVLQIGPLSGVEPALLGDDDRDQLAPTTREIGHLALFPARLGPSRRPCQSP